MVDIDKLILDSLVFNILGAEDDNVDSDEGEEVEESDSTEVTDDKVVEEDGRLKALKAERRLKREAEAEAKKLRDENEALKREKLNDIELAQAERDDALSKVESSTTRLDKLTQGFRRNVITRAIEEEAKAQNFIDVSDVVNHFDGVDVMDLFEVEQDEDDPSQVTLNTKAVASEIKKLATSKPHYINKGTDDGDATGSKFGGSKRKTVIDDEALHKLYSHL